MSVDSESHQILRAQDKCVVGESVLGYVAEVAGDGHAAAGERHLAQKQA
ncbi:Uncharacterised protein [Mycobacteroides abscessus subsp. abscessus]|nr:Uncharacterised protein [Mycobacteroides abscessus subsp. abscessus]